MLDNRSGLVYSVGAVGFSFVLRLMANSCPLASEDPKSVDFIDPKWGNATNVSIRPQAWGAEIQALGQKGRHRMIQVVNVATPGRYRLTVDTEYDALQSFMMEIGGGGQKSYGRLIGNLKTGKIVDNRGDIRAAGVETLSTKPPRFRWSLEMEFVAGITSFNFALLDSNKDTDFSGTASCKMILNNPTFAKAE